MSTKFAIGCLVQWYEIEMLPEYIDTLLAATQAYNKEDVLIDIRLSTNQDLEKAETADTITAVLSSFYVQTNKLAGYTLESTVSRELITISDYRREFNTKYCELADVLIWGESDMLVPQQTFIVLDHLHQNIQTPKYVATFAICKMWDESWKALEHPKFTDKPFIENDYDNWWSVKYTMSAEEMNTINNEAQDLDVTVTSQHKFNGCGLIISSEVIKAGVNIPSSVFFVHEDTAFMLTLNKLLPGTPQYIIKNILAVHNRNHPKKRMYVQGESGETMNQKRRSNDWYVKANKYSEENCYNIFNLNYKSKTWKDVWK